MPAPMAAFASWMVRKSSAVKYRLDPSALRDRKIPFPESGGSKSRRQLHSVFGSDHCRETELRSRRSLRGVCYQWSDRGILKVLQIQKKQHRQRQHTRRKDHFLQKRVRQQWNMHNNGPGLLIPSLHWFQGPRKVQNHTAPAGRPGCLL